MQQCPLNGGPRASEKRTTQRLRVSLFFDGTLNNRANAASNYISSLDGHSREEIGESYENVPSNIAEMERLLLKCGSPYTEHASIYIEGVGSEDGKKDNILGAATGYAGSGLKAKVSKGIKKIGDWLSTISNADLVEYVHVDAFGFSRGAAAARYFVHMALYSDQTIAQLLADKDFKLQGIVTVRFVGLFDTVAAYGAIIHSSNTWELSLNAICDATQTVQIAAAEEHRNHFELVNIDSAKIGKSIQIFLPGVHSDIGGGYPPGYSEDLILWEGCGEPDQVKCQLKAEKRWMIDQGWFTPDQLKDNFFEEYSDDGGVLVGTGHLTGRRVVGSNSYASLSGNIMIDFASEQDLKFNAMPKLRDQSLAPLVAQIDLYVAKIRALAGRDRLSYSTPQQWFGVDKSSNSALGVARSSFFHFSAHYNRVANMIQPNKPEWLGQQRHRTIFDG